MTLTISTAEFCSADEKFLPFQRYDTAFPVLLSLVLFKEEILFLASPFFTFSPFSFSETGNCDTVSYSKSSQEWSRKLYQMLLYDTRVSF